MGNSFLFTFVVLIFVKRSSGCLATSAATTPIVTTTLLTTTTTTTTTSSPTTITTSSPQDICSPSNIIYTTTDGGIKIDTHFRDYVPGDPASIVIYCTAQDTYTAFMQFNYNQGGPLENGGETQTIQANLTCTVADNQWVYTAVVNGVSYTSPVNEVSCNESPNP